MTLHCPDSLTAIAGFYHNFTASKLDRLGDIYGPGIVFHDPLQTATGLDEVRELFGHRLRLCKDMTITVLDVDGDDRTGFLAWTWKYRHRGEERVIHGASHCKFAPDGRIREQRDCWDACGLLVGDVPVLGWLVRRIKRRAGAQV